MKRKSKLMLGISAMVLAAGAVGVTGTFAWFAATSPTITPTTAGQSATITSVAGFTSVNGFTVAVEAASISDITTVLLTDASGNTYSTLSDGGSDVLMPDASGTKIATVTPTLSITYTGSASTAEEIEALWDAAIAAHPIDLTITDVTLYDTKAHMNSAGFSDSFWNYVDAKEDEVRTHVAGTDYGLKFTSGDANYAVGNASVNVTKAVSTIATIGFANPTGSGSSRTTTKTSVASGVSFYVGVIGVNGVVQDANDTYGYKVAPALH